MLWDVVCYGEYLWFRRINSPFKLRAYCTLSFVSKLCVRPFVVEILQLANILGF